MEKEILRPVLQEILQEQQQSNKDQQELIVRLDKVEQQIRFFDQKLLQVKLNVPPINTAITEQILDTGVQRIHLMLQRHFQQLEQFSKKKQLKEQIFQWVPWLLVILLCGIIFKIAIGGCFHGSIF